MNKLILSMLCMFLLSAYVNAQQQPNVNVDVNPNPKNSVNISTPKSFNINTDVNVKTNVTMQDQDLDDPMKAKTFTKLFSLDKNDKVNLSNQYGAITIKTWDKSEIKVDADIKAYSNTEAEAQKLLDDASIIASKTGDLVSFKTMIENQNSNGWSWGKGSKNGKKWRREVKIYITVYMPASNALNASQSYGNIIMDDFSGPTSLRVQYGNLTTGDLRNSNNYISVSYGNANLKNVNQAKINNQYGSRGGGVTMASINDLELEAEYTAVNIGTIKNNANIKHQYGSGVIIGYAGSLNLTAQYANVKVDKLGGVFTGKVQYGNLDIANIEAGCKIFNADTDYSSVNIGFSPSFNAAFNVNTNYGGFKYGGNVTAKKATGDKSYSSSKSYSGQIGKGGTNNVNIKTEHGSVIFR